ncbi:PFL_4703 family integrating conjugative element protein [Aliikangiella maris]|uniref:PFL_4703 family integrating conjugative element protein n=2 Tax=Aliikangiella maris TaxID=3162458 RepID=A0ABV3MTT0_9GAMM
MNTFSYSNLLKGVGYTNIFLFIIVIMLVGLAILQNRSIDLARKELTIRFESDLRSGTVRKAWEIPNVFVYGFALTIVQKINNWQKDGGDDYQANLNMLQNYITPHCREFLSKDIKKKNSTGQLRNRLRIIQEMSGVGFHEDNSVRMVKRGEWNVDLSLNLKEFINNKVVKHRDVFWPVRIVEFNIDPEKNRQGLALDCYYKKPQILKDHRLEERYTEVPES